MGTHQFTIHTVSPVGSLTIGRVWDDTVTDAVDSPKQALANAAFIVATVNERAALREALAKATAALAVSYDKATETDLAALDSGDCSSAPVPR